MIAVMKPLTRPARAVLLTICLAACASTAAQTGDIALPAYQGVVSADASAGEVLALVEGARRGSGYPGIAISVRRGSNTLIEAGLGYADLEQGTPITPDSVFQIGSLTKSFTSILIAQLAVEGKIDLDAPVSAYLPDYRGPGRDVAVRHLMNHTAGLVNYTDLPDYFGSTREAVTRENVRALFENLPLMFAPGTAFTYSNSGTFTLGLIIEAATGQAYEAVLQERILAPLGMARSGYGDWRDVVKGRVEGYAKTAEGYRNAPVLEAEIPFSAGAIISTVRDIQTYIDKVHRQNVFGDEVRDILYTQMSFPDGEPLAYALGAFGITEWEGRRKIAHAGDIDGFSAYMAYYPDDDVSIVVMANTRDIAPTAVGLEQKAARIVFGSPRPDPSGAPLSDEEIGYLVGDYDAGRLRVGLPRVGIVEAGDTVAVRFGGQAVDGPAIPLIHLEGRRFMAAHDDEMEFVFGPETSAAEDVILRWLGGEIPFHRP